MDALQLIQTVVLGFVEGLTEFLPVSSTGHLLLLEHFFGLTGEANKTFAILIQLGSILAILYAYFGRLWKIASALPSDPNARRLVVGGLILMVVDQLNLPVRYTEATRFPLKTYLAIGFIQCLAMIPGVSRSGSTIVGAMALGADKRSAAEFSFYLAMPTMAGAFAYDLLKSYKILSFNDAAMIGLGFVVAFVSALFVVRTFLDYVSRHGFTLFAWWRIVVGAAG